MIFCSCETFSTFKAVLAHYIVKFHGANSQWKTVTIIVEIRDGKIQVTRILGQN